MPGLLWITSGLSSITSRLFRITAGLSRTSAGLSRITAGLQVNYKWAPRITLDCKWITLYYSYYSGLQGDYCGSQVDYSALHVAIKEIWVQ